MTSSLGDRQKGYEAVADYRLIRRMPVVIRMDGCNFHRWCRHLEKPCDARFQECMEYATYVLCNKVTGCRLGYVQSDEISLLLVDYQSHGTESWYNYRLSKMTSIAASMCTVSFNEMAAVVLPRHLHKRGPAMFDARAFNVPSDDIANYFLWRQRDCERNSIQGLAQAHFSVKQIRGKNGTQLQDMLMEEHGINWNDVPVRQKRGVAFYKVGITAIASEDPHSKEAIRNKWVRDYDMPIVSKNREYVDRWLDAEPVYRKFEGKMPDAPSVCESLDLYKDTHL